MTLDEWLTDQRITDAAFARQSGIGLRQIVNRYRRGISFPRPENLLRIQKATNGAVTAEDFLSCMRTPAPGGQG